MSDSQSNPGKIYFPTDDTCIVMGNKKYGVGSNLSDLKISGNINLTAGSSVSTAQLLLKNTGDVAFWLICDPDYKLPSSVTHYTVPSEIIQMLSCRSPNNATDLILSSIPASKFSPIGVNVGDIIALTRIKVKASDLLEAVGVSLALSGEIEIYQYKIISTNDAKAGNPGVMGLMTPGDKSNLNTALTTAQNALNTANSVNSKVNTRMPYFTGSFNSGNDCDAVGIYDEITLGRPAGNIDTETYILYTYPNGAQTAISKLRGTIFTRASKNSDWMSYGNTNGSAGTSNTPIYFNNGIATACTYSLNKTVPSNAVFTDTKVTSAANHYTPTAVAASALDAGTGYYIQTISRDDKGHVTGITKKALSTNADTVDGYHASGTGTNCLIRRGSIGTNSQLSSYWVKVAETLQFGNSADSGIIIRFDKRFVNHASNTIQINVRTDGNGNIYDKYIYSTDVNNTDVNIFRLYYDDTHAELWINIQQQWNYFNYTVLSEGGRTNTNATWTLYSGTITTAQTPTLTNYITPTHVDWCSSASYHYTPSTNTSSTLTAGTGKYISSINRDSKGHVTGISTGTLPESPDDRLKVVRYTEGDSVTELVQNVTDNWPCMLIYSPNDPDFPNEPEQLWSIYEFGNNSEYGDYVKCNTTVYADGNYTDYFRFWNLIISQNDGIISDSSTIDLSKPDTRFYHVSENYDFSDLKDHANWVENGASSIFCFDQVDRYMQWVPQNVVFDGSSNQDKRKVYFTPQLIPSDDGTSTKYLATLYVGIDTGVHYQEHPLDLVQISSDVQSLKTNKVDKVTGKGLSTNDYTTTEKNKLAGISSGAEVNQNAFSSIKIGNTTISADAKTDTLELVAGSNITLTPDATNDKITISATGTSSSTSGFEAININGTAYSPANSGNTIVLANGTNTTVSRDSDGTIKINATDTKYSAATTSAAGLMSSTDKTKLNGIATGANNYTHPTTSGNKHIPSGGSAGQILKWSADGTAVWGSDNNTTYSAVTLSTAGLVPKGDIGAYDGILVSSYGGKSVGWYKLNATDYTLDDANKTLSIKNKYTLPTASDTTLGGIKVGAGLSINSSTGVLSATGGGTADAVDWANVTSKPTFATVATSGSYNDLSNKPTIPAAYSLPVMTNTVRGGAKLVSNTAQTVAANSVTTTANRTYAVQKNSSEQLVVNVPWSNTTYGIASSSSNGLMSSDNYTKLSNIATEASNTTITNSSAELVKSSHTDGTQALSIGTGLSVADRTDGTAGAILSAPNAGKVTSNANHYTPSENTPSALDAGTNKYVTGIKRDSKGHVTGITSASIPNASASASGLMSSEDYAKRLTGTFNPTTKELTLSNLYYGSSSKIPVKIVFKNATVTSSDGWTVITV